MLLVSRPGITLIEFGFSFPCGKLKPKSNFISYAIDMLFVVMVTNHREMEIAMKSEAH